MVVDGGALGRAGLAGRWQRFSDLTRERSSQVTHYAEKFWGDVRIVVDAGLEPVLIDLVRDPRDVVASNRAQLPVPRLMIRYEDLINSPEDTRARVEDVTRIRMQPEMIGELTPEARKHITSTSVEASIGRWRHDLDEADIYEIERRLGPRMIELGYESSI